MRLTEEGFEALAAIRGLHDSPSRAALRAVLVDGMPQRRASEAYGLSAQAVNVSVNTSRRIIEKAQILCTSIF